MTWRMLILVEKMGLLEGSQEKLGMRLYGGGAGLSPRSRACAALFSFQKPRWLQCESFRIGSLAEPVRRTADKVLSRFFS